MKILACFLLFDQVVIVSNCVTTRGNSTLVQLHGVEVSGSVGPFPFVPPPPA